jgi:hypothetical protein
VASLLAAACETVVVRSPDKPTVRYTTVDAAPPVAASAVPEAPAVPATDTSPAPIAVGGAGVTLHLDGTDTELRSGCAVLGPNGLYVHLTDAPLACDSWPHPPQPSITFHLSAGPDGTFYAGKRVTTHIEYAKKGFGHVTLDPLDLAAGKRVTGRLDYVDPGSGHHNGSVVNPSHAKGSFDVVLCPVGKADVAALRPPRELASDGPLAFTVEGVHSRPKSVIVMAEYDDGDDEPWLSRVEAYEQAGVDCDHPFVSSGTDMKVYFGLESADLGVPQPARLQPDAFGSKTSRSSDVAWIRFEPFDLATANTAKFSVVALARAYDTPPGATTPEHLPPASLAGTVEAKICRFGSKFGKPYL